MTTPLPYLAQDWAAWALGASWQLALLVILIYPLSRLMRNLPSRLRYTLWSLVLVKAVLPPSLAAPWGVGNWGLSPAGEGIRVVLGIYADPIRASHTLQTFDPEIGVLSTNLDLAALSVTRPWLAPLLGALFLVWTLGILYFIASVAISQVRLALLLHRARLLTDGPIHAELLRQAKSLGITWVPALYLSDAAASPFLCGYVYGRIVLPAGLPALVSASDLRAVLRHELIHWRRGDLIGSWFQVFVQTLFWFHPLVWVANEMINEEREYCVDEAVVGHSTSDVFDYCRALLNVLRAMQHGTVSALCFLGFGRRKPEIVRRIDRLVSLQPAPGAFVNAGWCFIVVFALAFLPMSIPHAGLLRSSPTVNLVKDHGPPAASAHLPVQRPL